MPSPLNPPGSLSPPGSIETVALKQRTAVLSVISNSVLILLKVIAGTVTGSVAILTDAVHSSIDLVASIVAYFSIRKAGEPADDSHRYGHEKIENLAAAIEGILILVGSAAIAFESVRRLLGHGRIHTVGLGIGVVAFSIIVNAGVATVLARNARATESAALEGDAAHLRTDAITSAAVLVALALVKVTGAQWLDPVVALIGGGGDRRHRGAAAGPLLSGARRPGAPASRGGRDPAWRSKPSPRVGSSAITSCAHAVPGLGATSTSMCSSAPAPRSRTLIAQRTSSRI